MTAPQTGLLASRLETWRTGGDHIVDQLIAERTREISKHPLWPLIRPVLVRGLHYGEAVKMADRVARLDGRSAMEFVSSLLRIRLELSGTENIPRHGAVILMPNHPTGIADGIAMFDALKTIRPDMVFFANRDALRVSQGFKDIIIPVEWRAGAKSHTKSRDTLAVAARAFGDARAIVMFPSGRLAFWQEGKLTERPWQPSVVTLARRYEVPIVPVHITARNSGFFYFMSRFSSEIRDMTLFHELLNKKDKQFSLRFGRPIQPAELDGDPADIVQALHDHVTGPLAGDPGAVFDRARLAPAEA